MGWLHCGEQCKAQVQQSWGHTALPCTVLCYARLPGLFVMFVMFIMFIMFVMALAWQWPQRLFYLRLHGVEGERRIIQRLSVNCIHNPLSSQATAVCSWWVSADRRAAARAPASPCKYDIHFWQELIPSSLQCDQNNIYNSIPYSRGYTKYFLQLYMINSPSARCQTSWRFLILKCFVFPSIQLNFTFRQWGCASLLRCRWRNTALDSAPVENL